MGFRLLIYLSILSIGGILGYKDKISSNLGNRLDILQSICLFFLLFIMGIRIGLDEKVIQSFFTIGYKAGVIAIFTLVFSVLFVRIIKGLVIIKEGEDKVES